MLKLIPLEKQIALQEAIERLRQAESLYNEAESEQLENYAFSEMKAARDLVDAICHE